MDQILTMHADWFKAVQPAYILVEFTTGYGFETGLTAKTERSLNSCGYWSCLLIWDVYTVTR